MFCQFSEYEKKKGIQNFVDRIFGGELTSTIMCEECRTVSKPPALISWSLILCNLQENPKVTIWRDKIGEVCIS